MKVKFPVTKYQEVDLPIDKCVDVAVETIYLAFNLPYSCYLKDGKIMYDVEYWTSHSWFEEKTLRDATEDDLAALRVLENLENFKKK